MTVMQETLVPQITQTAAVGVVQDAARLNILAEPGRAAAVWQRHPTEGFQTWMDRLDADVLPSARLVLKPGHVSAALPEVCDAAGLPDGPHRQHLIGDIAALADLFSQVMGAIFVRLRLDRITTNACRRFHIDAVKARLVCTYRGTGTQYGVAQKGAEPDRIFTVPTGAPILLRGTLWPEQPAAGLLHRSPAIEGSGETRLVLVLDPIFDPAVET